MLEVNLVFPHQLFEDSPILENGFPVYLIEESLFFRQYGFHKQKLAFHRAGMKFYEAYLNDKNLEVTYIESTNSLSDVRKLIAELANSDLKTLHYIDPTDNWLKRRILSRTSEAGIECKQLRSPLFISESNDHAEFFRPDKKKFFQTKFYIGERQRLKILLAPADEPLGGKWSFDAENRKRYPRGKKPPSISTPAKSKYFEEARKYVLEHFEGNPGELDTRQIYPTDFASTRRWLEEFLHQRFAEFGQYEDAIVADELFLNHSVLSPMLNTGLITPRQIIDRAVEYSQKNDIPLNSVEGFVRQIIGWREFIRGVYESKGSYQRTQNFFEFNRKIPGSFYDGTTGVEPLDNTIRKVLKTGYCHHIERLMILGNFMVLCEFDPDEVYRWFMELFVDAYDWVMVPNVYGMSQYSDGGLMTTKPYISGSNYILKLSDYPKGDWQKVWDGLFWRFVSEHQELFRKNPRTGMMVTNLDRMDPAKKSRHIEAANVFISGMD